MAGYLMALVLEFWIHLSIMLAIVIINVVAYTILIIKTQTKHDLLPCCYPPSKDEEIELREDVIHHHIWEEGKTDFIHKENTVRKCDWSGAGTLTQIRPEGEP